MDYNDLLRAPLQLFATNRTLVNEMPSIIRQAEDECVLVLDHDLFRATEGMTVGTDGLLDLSTVDPRILEVRAIRVPARTGYRTLERRDIEYLHQLYQSSQAGLPRYYGEDPSLLHYHLFPAPWQSLDVQVTYNQHPPRLNDTDTLENVLTEQAPRAIEYATFMKAAHFMKDYQAAERYSGMFLEATNQTNMQVGRRRRDVTDNRPAATENRAGV